MSTTANNDSGPDNSSVRPQDGSGVVQPIFLLGRNNRFVAENRALDLAQVRSAARSGPRAQLRRCDASFLAAWWRSMAL
jgi:hypothetical protein